MLQCGELKHSVFETLTCTACGQKERYCNVHERVQDQLFREDLSTDRIRSSEKNQAVLWMHFVPAGQCMVEGRKESTGALTLFFLFPHLCLLTPWIFASEWVDLMVNR